MYVDEDYKSGTVIDGMKGGAVEYIIKLRGTNELIVITTRPPDGVMITDCIKISYGQRIKKLEKVHGDYCIRID